jgi:hypothetical protein
LFITSKKQFRLQEQLNTGQFKAAAMILCHHYQYLSVLCVCSPLERTESAIPLPSSFFISSRPHDLRQWERGRETVRVGDTERGSERLSVYVRERAEEGIKR